MARLIGDLRGQFRELVREELELLRTEMSEKFSRYGSDAISLGAGAVAAYAGLIVLLAGLAFLLAFALANVGLGGVLARFVGFAAVGLITSGAGAGLLFSSIKGFSKVPMAPQRSLGMIQRILPPSQDPPPAEATAPPFRPSKDLEPRVLATQRQFSRSLEKLTSRANPILYVERAVKSAQEHPYPWGLVALAAGFLASLVVFRQLTPSKSS
jgi:hypothetical protein